MTEARSPLVATGSQTVGPFFHVGPLSTDRFGRMASADTPGQHIRLHVRVVDGDDEPVSDAMIELWQADGEGRYPPAAAERSPSPPGFTGFGRLGTDETGCCVFETIKPGVLRGAEAAAQAPHINVCIFARGLLRHLYTRIYFDGDPALASDPLMSIVPAPRRNTLVARQTGEPSAWAFVVSLQGRDETVFFDV
jgi:protocatechuate 3,4-dioxygenase alpha subunit